MSTKKLEGGCLCGSIRYRVKHGDDYIASGKMSLAQALDKMQEATGKPKETKVHREDPRVWTNRYKIMRQLFADHEPAVLTANIKLLNDSRSDAIPQVAPAIFMIAILSKAANYQRLLLKKYRMMPQWKNSCEYDCFSVQTRCMARM